MKASRARTAWSSDDLLRLKHMIDAGQSIPEIAKELGRSQEGTRNRANQNGWYCKPRPRAMRRPKPPVP